MMTLAVPSDWGPLFGAADGGPFDLIDRTATIIFKAVFAFAYILNKRNNCYLYLTISEIVQSE